MARMGYCDDCGRDVPPADLLMTATGLRCLPCAQGERPPMVAGRETEVGSEADGPRAAKAGVRRRECRTRPMWLCLTLLVGAAGVFMFSHFLAQQLIQRRAPQYYRPISMLQAIEQAQTRFASERALLTPAALDRQVTPRYAGSLDELIEAGLLPADFFANSRYDFEVSATLDGWQAVALPVGFEGASFYLDQTGQLRWSKDGRAGETSPAFTLPSECHQQASKVRCLPRAKDSCSR